MTRIVIVGDTLLDRDLIGTADRLCPDAPAPVVDVTGQDSRPGGAGLAAVLAARDGHDVTLVTALAADPAAAELRELLGAGMRLIALPAEGSTAEKVRVRVAGHSVLRLDRGGPLAPPTGSGSEELAEAAEAVQSADVVLVCDYGRGLTGHPGIRALLAEAVKRPPVVWDPHPRGSAPVPSVRLATPNAAEARLFAPECEGAGLAGAAARASALVSAWAAGSVAVTLGASGALLSYGTGPPFVAPAVAAQATDTCGAGDRFALTAAVRLGEGDVASDAVQAAVVSASAYIAAGGVASLRAPQPAGPPARDPATLVARVRAAGGTVVATGGCFDLLHAGHVGLLRAARGLGDCLVVCLNSDDSVRRLKGAGRPLVPAADRIRVLEALECVDAVAVFEEDTPVQVLRRLRPDVWAKGGDYTLVDLPESGVVQEWGGQAVVLPYLPGRSTTGLLTRSQQNWSAS
ncbi:MAG: D-glycero-beta-D-manno-heptose 1-phosphate adenylyltransferase [Pseudonocardiales bacterium]